MRISVIVPTHERRDLVLACVRSLARQDYADPFEIIVVVDGSADGTAQALRDLNCPSLIVLEQANGGAAAARSRGGFAARGEVLLFVDDDMLADPRLLSEHDRSHREGAEIVVGHMPLHPDSPRGVLSEWVGEWVEERTKRLMVPGASVRLSDLVGGQISVRREAFFAVGGFDEQLTQGEDLDLGHRLLQLGYKAVFNPNAITWQKYVVTPAQYLRQCRERGRMSARAARLRPELARRLLRRPASRRRFRTLARVPLLRTAVSGLAITLLQRGHSGRLTRRVLFLAQALEFCRGVQQEGGVPRPRTLRVLAYHAITDTAGAGRFAPYGVSPDAFRRQIRTLRRVGFNFIGANEALNFLLGSGGLPRRPVLLTFDDCYESVLDHALPVLEEHRIPAVAFAVAGRIGETNDWSRAAAASPLSLLDREGLRRLRDAGVEIGAHSRTHPPLTRLESSHLLDEVAGSCRDLKAMELGDIRLFAYPYGECDSRVQHAVMSAGCEAAFTVQPGLVRRGTDPYLIPRIEILREDTGWRFLWKVIAGGHSSTASGASPAADPARSRRRRAFLRLPRRAVRRLSVRRPPARA